jgi:signal transduction histidine kinase
MLPIDRPAGVLVFVLLLVLTALLCVALRRFRRALVGERSRRLEGELALERATALDALSRALSKAQTRAEVAHACLSELLPAAAIASGAVAAVGEDDGHLTMVTAMGYADSESAARYTVTLASKTVLTEVVRRQKPLAFSSRKMRFATLGDLMIDPILDEAEAAIVMPLLVSGRTIGVIVLTQPDVAAPEWAEGELLVGAAARVAPALDRATRFERAERARADSEAYRTQADIEIRERERAEAALRESEARYRALAARTTRLYTLSAGLSEAVTLAAVAKVIVNQGKVVVGASAGSVALLGEEAQFETLYAEEYPRELAESSQRFPAEPGFCATAAVDTRRPVFIGSFAEWQQQYPRSASMAADGGFASVAALPLLVEGMPIGVLSFHFTVPVNFDDSYRALLTSVAHHAAQAIDRARLYEGAQRAQADAEAANRSKDDFLSIVSHELRTPLSAVLGWATMLRGHALDEGRRAGAIEAIHRNATRQARLIDELLDVSRIVAGRAPLDLQEVDLAANVRGAIETIMPLAEAKGLTMEVAPLPEVMVVADPHRLEQVFVNLLGNAVKFTPSGGTVTVDIERADRAIDVCVRDTGRGIDAGFLPHVFERFRQADGAVTRTVGGLGLGLFIARRLVEAHGGHIRVESDGENRGATFTVSLPHTEGRAAMPRAASADASALLDEPSSAVNALPPQRAAIG